MLSENISRDPDGTLRFAGHSVTELAARYGTPLYLFDEERIRANCRMYKEAFRKHFGAGSLPLYASKAASFKEMYRIMADEGMGVDAVSAGEIHTALAAGFPADVFYICEDREESFGAKQAEDFRIRSLYPYLPRIRGMMREILISDPGGSCTGYRREKGLVLPVLEEREPCREESLVLEAVRRGALAFAEDFRETFGEVKGFSDIDPREASLPLEGMLAAMTERDLALFAPFLFEDRVYGGAGKIRVRDLFRSQLSEAGFLSSVPEERPEERREKARALRDLCRRALRHLPGGR